LTFLTCGVKLSLRGDFMTLGQKLKARRRELNLTQGQVAKKVGVATQTIYKYENEIVTNMPLDRLELIAAVLEVTPAYLMGWEEITENTEKKNDAIADIILRLRTDNNYLEVVQSIGELSPEQLSAVKSFLSAFNNKM
jgi:transcriptional regulator with XRE-family HTH domain